MPDDTLPDQALRRRLAAAEARLRDREAQVEGLSARLQEARETGWALEARLREQETAASYAACALAEEASELRRRVEAMEASTSWRLTRPLRAVMRRLKRSPPLVLAAVHLAAKPQIAPDLAPPAAEPEPPPPQSAYEQWLKTYAHVFADRRARLAALFATRRIGPLISVITPVHDPDPAWIEAAIQSVVAQLNPNWELVLVDDGSRDPAVRAVLDRAEASDDRIRLIRYEAAQGVVDATNAGVQAATGVFVAFLDHDDLIAPDALALYALEIEAHPEAQLLFSDEDRLDGETPSDPHFKTGWNAELMRAQNAVNHFCAVRRDLYLSVGGLRLGFEGSQDYDLVLRVVDEVGADAVRHLPFVLYRWRRDRRSMSESDPSRSAAAGRRAVQEHLARTGVTGAVEAHGIAPTWHRVRYALRDPMPKVSVLVPTRDCAELTAQCASGVLERTDYPDLELIIIDNGSVEPQTAALFERLAADPRVTVLRDDRPFNFSALNNAAARAASGEVLVLMNNDVEALDPDWLTEMVAQVMRPDVGAVGAKLFYPDGCIQHAGVLLGVRTGVGDHLHIGEPGDTLGYMGRAAVPQEVSAVTGACLAIRKATYEALGGMDEVNLTVAFNDVDLCLRVWEAGLKVIWTPYAKLLHHESASRGSDQDADKIDRARREVDWMQTRWRTAIDGERHYNPNFTLDTATFDLGPPPAVDRWLAAAERSA
ncbi:N/A [soil metagenome]